MMPIEKKPISRFKPAPFNPRKKLKPGDPDFESLRKSVIEFDHVQLIVANKNGMVLGGHQTLEVLKSLGRDGANARLIALAPDMLEAIAKAYEEHERGSQVVARQIIAAVYNKAMDAGLL
jgi:ParB-like chromosome segregation protein Spo0J